MVNSGVGSETTDEAWALARYRADVIRALLRKDGSRLDPAAVRAAVAAWTATNPVRLVPARIILLAGLSHYPVDPGASFRRVREAAGFRTGFFLGRWMNALPPHARSCFQ